VLPSSPEKTGWSSLATVSTEKISTEQHLLELPAQKLQQFVCKVESTPILEMKISFSTSLDMSQHAILDQ
jgi:hypothetical protein